MKYEVTANDVTLGIYDAEDAQGARDAAARDAGYASESAMEGRMDQASELVAVPMDDDAIIAKWHEGESLTEEEAVRHTAIMDEAVDANRRIHRHARPALPPSERQALMRARRKAEGIKRIEVPLDAYTLDEIDRRADALMTSRAVIIQQAIDLTR